MQKRDLSVHEMLSIRTLKLNLNVQSDSFVPKTKAEAGNPHRDPRGRDLDYSGYHKNRI